MTWHPTFAKFERSLERSFAKVGPRGALFRKKRAVFGQNPAGGAGWAGARSEMTEGERIVLGDEDEGNSEDSDPVLVSGEASVGGSAGVSAGPSSENESKTRLTSRESPNSGVRGPMGRLFDESLKTT